MNSKTLSFIFLAIIISTNLFWLYIFVDQSVSYDHLQREITYLREDRDLMRNLMMDFNGSISMVEVRTILKNNYSNQIIKEENGSLFVDDIGFKFKNNKLTGIVFMNE